MLKFIIRRLFLLIPVLLGVSILTFSLIHIIPGDPARSMLGEKATEYQIELLRADLGLNDPYIVQYGRFLGDILQGDLGESIQSKENIAFEIFHKLPATGELTIFAIILAIVVGILAGVIAAVKQYSWFDNIIRTGVVVGVVLPIFWLGVLMMRICSMVFIDLSPSGTST